MDGKPLMIEGSHIDPNIFLKTITDEDGTTRLEIHTPDPENEEEEQLENEAMKKIRKQMQAINQNKPMIIPFLLTISPANHSLCLESKITQEFSQKEDKVCFNSLTLCIRIYRKISKAMFRARSGNIKLFRVI